MIKVTEMGFWIDPALADNVRSLAHNMKNDWDFVALMSGTGMTRVGKSMMAQQLGKYVSHLCGTPFGIANIVFTGDELIETAFKLPKNSVIIYDEARAELDNKKVMGYITQKLMDFFNECGTFNHFIIVVLPNFFDLPKGLAIGKSEILLNLFRTSTEKKDEEGNTYQEFTRGHYQFFNRQKKKNLYIKGKKEFENYSAEHPNFVGEYRKQWVIPFEEYDAKKMLYLRRARSSNAKPIIQAAIRMVKHPKLSMLTRDDVAQICGITRLTLYRHLKKQKLINEADEIDNFAGVDG